MTTSTKLIGAGAAVAVLSAGGLGLAGLQSAQADPTATPGAGGSPSAGQSPAKSGTAAKAEKSKHQKQLLGRALHGEATVGGAKKTRVIDFQRGTVTKVDGSVITVKSADGFSASYTADDKTKVRKDKKKASIGDVKVNDRVRVLGTKGGSTITLKRVVDAGPKK